MSTFRVGLAPGTMTSPTREVGVEEVWLCAIVMVVIGAGCLGLLLALLQEPGVQKS